eukprot:8048970-Pyramimonas_sp.AAC.2
MHAHNNSPVGKGSLKQRAMKLFGSQKGAEVIKVPDQKSEANPQVRFYSSTTTTTSTTTFT